MSKNYNSIDLFKFICALLIIIAHANPFDDYSKILSFGVRNIVCVIAVPFFFVASGFLCFRKVELLEGEEKKNYIKKFLKRILLMYLLWSAIYFVFVAINWINNGFTIYSVLEYVRDFFFEGSYQTIWFLPALFSATLIVYLLRKKLSYKQIFIISLPFYLFTLLGSSYYGIAENIPVIRDIYNVYYSVFETIKNGVCFGFIYVTLGALIATNIEKIKISKKINIALIIVFYILLAIEEFVVAHFNWNSRSVDTVIMLLPLSFFIFTFVLNLELKDRKVYGTLRKYSLLMFLSQRIPLTIFELCLGNTLLVTNSMIYFVSILLCTLLLSFIIIKLSDKYTKLKVLF